MTEENELKIIALLEQILKKLGDIDGSVQLVYTK
jgi:hypothetical protein